MQDTPGTSSPAPAKGVSGGRCLHPTAVDGQGATRRDPEGLHRGGELLSVHDFGALAPNAKLRPLIVPAPPDAEESSGDPCDHSVAWEQTSTGRTIRRTWVPWATLLMRVLAVDVLECPKCENRMQRIAVVTRRLLRLARGAAAPAPGSCAPM